MGSDGKHFENKIQFNNIWISFQSNQPSIFLINFNNCFGL